MPWRPSLQCSPVHAAVTAAADADGVSACCASSLLFDVFIALCHVWRRGGGPCRGR